MLKPTLLAAVVAASLGTVAAPSAAQVGVTINIGPPALRYEAVPAPRRGYDWAPGFWVWSPNRQRHNWVAGSWMRSRPGYIYQQPNWVENGGRWQHRRGAWAHRDIDRDGDGIRNRNDRDRDGDGVPNRRDNAPDNPRRN